MDYFLLTTLKSLRFLKIFDIITFMGDFKFLFFVICIIYWNNSKNGVKLIKSTLMATNATQICKLVFSVSRPFQIYKNIDPSKYAMSSATGFSFPSGHAQASMSVYGYLANSLKKNYLYILAFLVALSRIVLGVHTLRDVVFGLIIGLVFIRLTTGNLLVMALISLLFSAFRYIKGVPIPFVLDGVVIGILSLLFLMNLSYIENVKTSLNKKQILIGILPLVLSECIFYFIYPIHNLEYIVYIIYMFIYPKLKSTVK